MDAIEHSPVVALAGMHLVVTVKEQATAQSFAKGSPLLPSTFRARFSN